MTGSVLVTGGAGYIGAHVARGLAERGWSVVVLDDLSTGFREFVPAGMTFVEASVTDEEAVRHTLVEHDIRGVVHVAALKWAGVSVTEPLRFYRVNVEGTRTLLQAMADRGVETMVFSSSCAIYGTPAEVPVTEETPFGPESPYGETKLIGEWLTAATARAHGLRHTSLRYFNVVGSSHEDLFDASPYNLLPLVLEAISEGRRPKVFGTDYPTPDGSCVRDYVHVADITDAHTAVFERLASGGSCAPLYNVGTGTGYSVLEVLDAIRRVTGIDFEHEVMERRPGDPARVLASADRLRSEFAWEARRDLDEMVASAWKAWQRRS